MDSKTKISELKEKVKKFVQERDWERFHHPKELAISLNLEASELLEIFQWREKMPIEEIRKDEELIQKIKEELADMIMYAIAMANQTGIDVSEAVFEKLKLNEKKYPVDKAKGSSKKYSEL